MDFKYPQNYIISGNSLQQEVGLSLLRVNNSTLPATLISSIEQYLAHLISPSVLKFFLIHIHLKTSGCVSKAWLK